MKTWYIVRSETNYFVVVPESEVKGRRIYGEIYAKDFPTAVKIKNMFVKESAKCLNYSKE